VDTGFKYPSDEDDPTSWSFAMERVPLVTTHLDPRLGRLNASESSAARADTVDKHALLAIATASVILNAFK
jgi:hypothetical protein